MPATPTIASARSSRLGLRATPGQETVLRRAAEVAHKSLTDFILDAAYQAAEQTLLDQRLLDRSMSFSAPQALGLSHRLDEFDCGKPALAEWLLHHTRQAQGSGSARTFVVCEQDARWVLQLDRRSDRHVGSAGTDSARYGAVSDSTGHFGQAGCGQGQPNLPTRPPRSW